MKSHRDSVGATAVIGGRAGYVPEVMRVLARLSVPAAWFVQAARR